MNYKKIKPILLLTLCVLLAVSVSACKQPDAEDAVAAAVQAEGGAKKVSVSPRDTAEDDQSAPPEEEPATDENEDVGAKEPAPKEQAPQKKEQDSPEKTGEPAPLPEDALGEQAQNCSAALPAGIPYKTLYLNDAYCKGMEAYIPNSYCNQQALKSGEIRSGMEEYVYTFESALLNGLQWCDKPHGTDNRPDASSYSAFMKAFGKDGLIVVGSTTGSREGHNVYYEASPAVSSVRSNGFTLTDFTVEEVIAGKFSGNQLRIKENYYLANYNNGNGLMHVTQDEFFLADGVRTLLFLKKIEGLDCYEVFGGRGGFPLTDDYKAYDQAYLDHLAGYLNYIPSECARQLEEALTREKNNFYDVNGAIDQSDRNLKEALAANADDLLVAFVQKYKIKIWPSGSRGFEDAGLPYTELLSLACSLDLKSARDYYREQYG